MTKIVLLGYMGCGKSTIAKKLSQLINIPFVDLDQYIEEKLNLSVSAIFEQRGEIYFRKVEHESFVALLSSPDSIIIGLGGGTPCYANNHELLKQEGVLSVYLKASVATLFKRLSLNKSKRPLIANKTNEQMEEFIAMHVFERSFYYNQAKFIVTVDNKTVDETVRDISTLLA
ncbi:AAA family ATPase [Flavobacterium sp. F-380]|uniref:Shikimate kinase n=1 Tax=Flavobacterium kayseriense TaxID=2764714 RepID=A0ABR7J2N7_9FLAO|nr:shikimate kinase [Flavobacterium kayseriense]MBC5839816.1 AAA family ATPase [Flavobacterium kayseriense]MBC5847514.1 AAA family ATPase [Flavobacterium kayseriense]